MWFAFKLVSLNHWIQQRISADNWRSVVICFQISIFEPLNTAGVKEGDWIIALWFAFKLVSLNHWIQQKKATANAPKVVICFQISIFEPLNTAKAARAYTNGLLWFAFKLVSLNHWIQPTELLYIRIRVVICFQISIFEPLNTASYQPGRYEM